MSFVLSVERLTATITGTNTTSDVDITLGQTYTNCFLRHTIKTAQGDTSIANRLVEVYWKDSNTITVERNGTTDIGTITVEIAVVEVDPDLVQVQYTGWSISSGSSNDTITFPEEVATESTFVIHTWRTGYTGTDYGRQLVRCTVDATTGATVDRISTTNTITGSAFIVTALTEEFAVYHLAVDLAASIETGTETVGVLSVGDCMLLTSALTTNSNDDWEDLCHRAWLAQNGSNVEVNVSRANGGSCSAVTMNVSAQVVAFDGGQGILVQRGTFVITGTSDTDTLGTAIDVDESTIHGTTVLGIGEGDSTSNTEMPNWWCAMVITDSTTVTGSVVTDTTTDATYSYEVVDWNITAGGGTTYDRSREDNVEIKETRSGLTNRSRSREDNVEIEETRSSSSERSRSLEDSVEIAETISHLLETELDCYDESNLDSSYPLGFLAGVSQSFEGNGGKLTRIRVWLSKASSPTGDVSCALIAHTGTYGTSSVPTGAPIQTSATTYNVSEITGTPAAFDFYFDGTQTLTSGTKYCILLGGITGDITNYIGVGNDITSPTAPGNAAWFTGGSWHPQSGGDLIYCVFVTGSVAYSDSVEDNVEIKETRTSSATRSRSREDNVELEETRSHQLTYNRAREDNVEIEEVRTWWVVRSYSRTDRIEIAESGSGAVADDGIDRSAGDLIEIKETIAFFVTRYPEAVIISESDIANSPLLRGAEMSVLEVWNHAIVALGGARLTSINDNSRAVRIIAPVWEGFRRQWLMQNPWNGAKTARPLEKFLNSDASPVVPSGESSYRWSYAYLFPDEEDTRPYLHAIAINGRALRGDNRIFDVEVCENDEGTLKRCLVTNEPSVVLEYIFDTGDQNIDLLDAQTKFAMGLALAVHVAAQFKATSNIDRLKQEAMEAAVEAKATDSQEGTGRRPQSNPLTDVRYT